MLRSYKKKIRKRDMPKDFEEQTVKSINRICVSHTVVGVLFLRNGFTEMYTLPETMAQVASVRLPQLTSAIHRAVTELDILDELVAFRVETKTVEILAAAGPGFIACVVHKVKRQKKKNTARKLLQVIMKISTNLLKDTRDEWLARTSASINRVNPIIDRIMEDESVEGVIMTNKEGAPILTNVSLTAATHYGLSINKYGNLAQNYIKELDPFDAIIVMRINTKKIEIMVAPDPEFNIIVIQHGRHKTKLVAKKILNK